MVSPDMSAFVGKKWNYGSCWGSWNEVYEIKVRSIRKVFQAAPNHLSACLCPDSTMTVQNVVPRRIASFWAVWCAAMDVVKRQDQQALVVERPVRSDCRPQFQRSFARRAQRVCVFSFRPAHRVLAALPALLVIAICFAFCLSPMRRT